MAQAENLTGRRFGMLTVLQQAENRSGRTLLALPLRQSQRFPGRISVEKRSLPGNHRIQRAALYDWQLRQL